MAVVRSPFPELTAPGSCAILAPEMDAICPQCRTPIAMDDVNVATDIALCRRCGRTFALSDLVGSPSDAGVDLNTPPAGTWFEHLPDGFRAGAPTRSWLALFLIPFTCVWSGISLSGIYGRQLESGNFDLHASLFGLPFLIGTLFLLGYDAMIVAGKVEVRRQGDTFTVFTGVGPLGWTRNYTWSDFASIREETRGYARRRRTLLILDGKRRATFGTLLSEERRYFLLSALRQMLRANTRPSAPLTFARFR